MIRRNNLLLKIGVAIILVMAMLAVLAPVLSPYDPNEMSLINQFEGPSAAHPFGRDQNGSDVFSRVLFGARVSLSVGVWVVLISGTIGLCVGSVSGYFGGWVDSALMRVIDILLAFPGFLLALSLVAVMGPSLNNLIFALCLTGWTGYARLVRGEILHLREREYIVAARAIGATGPRIVTRHIWPNLVGLLVVQATFGIAGTVLSESALSFLGLGVPASQPTWGGLLNAGRKYLSEAPHISIFPGLCIVIFVLGFNLIGDGVRDFLDSRKN